MGRELSDNFKGVLDQISDLTADLLSEGEDPAHRALSEAEDGGV